MAYQNEFQSYLTNRPSLANKSFYLHKPRNETPKPAIVTGFENLSDYDLRLLCFEKNATAIKEFELRRFPRLRF